MAEEEAAPRHSFGPVVLTGLATATLLAVAGGRVWMVVDGLPATDPVAGGPTSAAGQVPLASALGLVLLASWGVLLVTRGVVRRAMALVALVAALGAVVVAVGSWWWLPSDLTDVVASGPMTLQDIAISPTRWFSLGLLAALAGVVAAAGAVRWAPTWPAMGSRYDAPGTAAKQPGAEDASPLGWWRAMDEGRDPTSPGHE